MRLKEKREIINNNILLNRWILKNNGGVCSTIAGNGLINWIYEILSMHD